MFKYFSKSSHFRQRLQLFLSFLCCLEHTNRLQLPWSAWNHLMCNPFLQHGPPLPRALAAYAGGQSWCVIAVWPWIRLLLTGCERAPPGLPLHYGSCMQAQELHLATGKCCSAWSFTNLTLTLTLSWPPGLTSVLNYHWCLVILSCWLTLVSITGPSLLRCGGTVPMPVRMLTGHLAVTYSSQLPCCCGSISWLWCPDNNGPKWNMSAILKCVGMKKWNGNFLWWTLSWNTSDSLQPTFANLKRHCWGEKKRKKDPKSHPVT